MNVKLQHVISSITGKTGLAIIQAIVDGERSPRQLAKLRDHRIRSDEATVARSLQGHWLEEHIFELTQALELYRVYQAKIHECDREIETAWNNLRVAATAARSQQSTVGAVRATRRASISGPTCIA